jgi:hypothetical protein
MKWLTNIYDPSRPDAQLHVYSGPKEDRDRAWKDHLAWLKDKVILEPQATDTYTVEQLEEMGMVGVYSSDN